MKISQILRDRPRGVSFEFFPPRTPKGRQALKNTVSALKQYDPLYVSMTYGAGGGARERTKDAVTLLLENKNLEIMPHLTCIGAQNSEIKEILAEYTAKGIENIMALRGDPPQGNEYFSFNRKDFFCAADLVKVLKNKGNFCIGVAVYPEGHVETTSLAKDLEYTKQKIESGADFAVTQMFFENKYYYRFLERLQATGIKIPVLPGILPLTDPEKVKQFAKICRTTIPEKITDKMEKARFDNNEMEKIGIDFTIEQCRNLIKHGIKRLHFFTLNKPKVMTRILNAISSS